MALTTISPALQDTQAQYTGFKNRIINGAMGIWQRGTSFAANAYTADRWQVYSSTGIGVSQSSDVPAGFKYSLSVTGTAYPVVFQRIESINSLDLVGQDVTVSFWLKQSTGSGANAAGVQLAYPTATDNYTSVTIISSTNITTTASWAYYSVTFTNLPSSVANGLQVLVGSNTASSTYLITGVQLEKGSTATSFDYRPYGTELALCQRYYFNNFQASALSATGSYMVGIPRMPVQMRTAPTVNLQSGSTIGYDLTGAITASITPTAFDNATALGFRWYGTLSGYGGVAGFVTTNTIQASAEL